MDRADVEIENRAGWGSGGHGRRCSTTGRRIQQRRRNAGAAGGFPAPLRSPADGELAAVVAQVLGTELGDRQYAVERTAISRLPGDGYVLEQSGSLLQLRRGLLT